MSSLIKHNTSNLDSIYSFISQGIEESIRKLPLENKKLGEFRALVHCIAYLPEIDISIAGTIIENSHLVHNKIDLIQVFSKAFGNRDMSELLAEIEKAPYLNLENYVIALERAGMLDYAEQFLIEYASSNDKSANSRLMACKLIEQHIGEIGLLKTILLDVYETLAQKGFDQNNINVATQLSSLGFYDIAKEKTIQLLDFRVAKKFGDMFTSWEKLVDCLSKHIDLDIDKPLANSIIRFINSEEDWTDIRSITRKEKAIILKLLFDQGITVMESNLLEDINITTIFKILEHIANNLNEIKSDDNHYLTNYLPNLRDGQRFDELVLMEIGPISDIEEKIQKTMEIIHDHPVQYFRIGALYYLLEYHSEKINWIELLSHFIKNKLNPSDYRLGALGRLAKFVSNHDILAQLTQIEQDISDADPKYLLLLLALSAFYLHEGLVDLAKEKTKTFFSKMNEFGDRESFEKRMEFIEVGTIFPKYYECMIDAWVNCGKQNELFDILEATSGNETFRFSGYFSKKLFCQLGSLQYIEKIIDSPAFDVFTKANMLQEYLNQNHS